eukprot:767867-Hanusia_phi.AAC.3
MPSRVRLGDGNMGKNMDDARLSLESNNLSCQKTVTKKRKDDHSKQKNAEDCSVLLNFETESTRCCSMGSRKKSKKSPANHMSVLTQVWNSIFQDENQFQKMGILSALTQNLPSESIQQMLHSGSADHDINLHILPHFNEILLGPNFETYKEYLASGLLEEYVHVIMVMSSVLKCNSFQTQHQQAHSKHKHRFFSMIIDWTEELLKTISNLKGSETGKKRCLDVNDVQNFEKNISICVELILKSYKNLFKGSEEFLIKLMRNGTCCMLCDGMKVLQDIGVEFLVELYSEKDSNKRIILEEMFHLMDDERFIAGIRKIQVPQTKIAMSVQLHSFALVRLFQTSCPVKINNAGSVNPFRSPIEWYINLCVYTSKANLSTNCCAFKV